MKINFGCYERKLPGFINVDINSRHNPEIIHDLNEFPYPFGNNTADFIYANEIIEHLKFPNQFLSEVKRILKPVGGFFIKTPIYPYKYLYDILLDKKISKWESQHISKFSYDRFRTAILSNFQGAMLLKVGGPMPRKVVAYKLPL